MVKGCQPHSQADGEQAPNGSTTREPGEPPIVIRTRSRVLGSTLNQWPMNCASDARVTYAKITQAGTAKLREAAKTHLRGVDELFVGRYSESELTTLADLLSRLPLSGRSNEACT